MRVNIRYADKLIEDAQQTILHREKAGLHFDIAMIDSDLSDSDGVSPVRWVNGQGSLNMNIVLLLTSANHHNKKTFDYLGINASVIKPARPSDLLDAIMVAQGITDAEPVEYTGGMEALLKNRDIPPLRILVAEDNSFNQKYLTSLLKHWGFVPTVVNNGRRAFEAIKSGTFDIVLMDIEMPEMDGYEATRAIRINEKQTGKHVPIVAMTAHTMKGDRELCIDAGMDDYVSKPISQEKLLESIIKLGLIEVATPSPGDKPQVDQVQVSTSKFDNNTLIEAVGGDADFLKEVTSMFLDDYPAMMENMEKSVKNRDGKGLRETAHALKGMLRSFAAETACAAVVKLEGMGHAEVFEGIDQVYNNLTVEITAFEKLLRTHVKNA